MDTAPPPPPPPRSVANRIVDAVIGLVFGGTAVVLGFSVGSIHPLLLALTLPGAALVCFVGAIVALALRRGWMSAALVASGIAAVLLAREMLNGQHGHW